MGPRSTFGVLDASSPNWFTARANTNKGPIHLPFNTGNYSKEIHVFLFHHLKMSKLKKARLANTTKWKWSSKWWATKTPRTWASSLIQMVINTSKSCKPKPNSIKCVLIWNTFKLTTRFSKSWKTCSSLIRGSGNNQKNYSRRKFSIGYDNKK